MQQHNDNTSYARSPSGSAAPSLCPLWPSSGHPAQPSGTRSHQLPAASGGSAQQAPPPAHWHAPSTPGTTDHSGDGWKRGRGRDQDVEKVSNLSRVCIDKCHVLLWICKWSVWSWKDETRGKKKRTQFFTSSLNDSSSSLRAWISLVNCSISRSLMNKDTNTNLAPVINCVSVMYVVFSYSKYFIWCFVQFRSRVGMEVIFMFIYLVLLFCYRKWLVWWRSRDQCSDESGALWYDLFAWFCFLVTFNYVFIRSCDEPYLSSLRMPFWLLKLNGSIAAEVPNRSSNLVSTAAWEVKIRMFQVKIWTNVMKYALKNTPVAF